MKPVVMFNAEDGKVIVQVFYDDVSSKYKVFDSVNLNTLDCTSLASAVDKALSMLPAAQSSYKLFLERLHANDNVKKEE